MKKKTPAPVLYGEAPYKWPHRNSYQIKGVRAQLVGSINACRDGATVEIDWKTAQNLVEICNQSIHFEEAQEPFPAA